MSNSTTAAAVLLAALAPAAIAQNATVNLTHDDADGTILVGETVTWSLVIEYEQLGEQDIVSGLNAALTASDAGLAAASDFAFRLNESALTDPIVTATADGIGGFEQIGFINSLLLDFDSFLFTADRRNPLPVGSFQTTALSVGQLTYGFSFSTLDSGGAASNTFMTHDQSAFNSYLDVPIENITFNIDTLTIVPAPASALLLAPAALLASRRRQ
ncbi:MAG: hypothetical protein ACI89L_002746 [Phycisphaerales bacterium]|jgi:uncharacterized protein YdbL (DUF1318 family)